MYTEKNHLIEGWVYLPPRPHRGFSELKNQEYAREHILNCLNLQFFLNENLKNKNS